MSLGGFFPKLIILWPQTFEWQCVKIEFSVLMLSDALLLAANWLKSRYFSLCVLYFRKLMSCHSFKTSSTPLHALFTSKQLQKGAKTNIMFRRPLSIALSAHLPSAYWSHPVSCVWTWLTWPTSDSEAFKAWQHSRKRSGIRVYRAKTQNMKKVAIKGLISISEKLQVAAVSFD